MPDTDDTTERLWMVVTLRSGVQIRTLVTEYRVRRGPTGAMSGLDWTTPADSPTRLRHVEASQIDAIHTEVTEETPDA